MTLDAIFSLWEKDSVIDRLELSNSSLDTPKLHHKYLRIYSAENIRLKKMEQDANVLYKLKTEYYIGTLDQETMKERGWEPNALKILKADLPTYIKADTDIINSNLALGLQKEKVSVLESILKTIANRGFAIKNAIDYIKFQAGE